MLVMLKVVVHKPRVQRLSNFVNDIKNYISETNLHVPKLRQIQVFHLQMIWLFQLTQFMI
jgi:hypothetical protein